MQGQVLMEVLRKIISFYVYSISYDISFVDGYTLPMHVMARNKDLRGKRAMNKCGTINCLDMDTTFQKCPPEMRQKGKDGKVAACLNLGNAMVAARDRTFNNPFKYEINKLNNNGKLVSAVGCTCGKVGNCGDDYTPTPEQKAARIIEGPKGLYGEDTTGYCCRHDIKMSKDKRVNDKINRHKCYPTLWPKPMNGFGNGKRYDEIFKSMCKYAYSWAHDDRSSMFHCGVKKTIFVVQFCK